MELRNVKIQTFHGRVPGLEITYRSLAVLVLLGLIAAVAAGGYLYARLRQQHEQIRITALQRDRQADAVRDLAAANERLQRRTEQMQEQSAETVREQYVEVHGEPGQLHVKLMQAFQERNWTQTLAISDEILKQKRLDPDLLQDVVLKQSSALIQKADYDQGLAAVEAGLDRLPNSLPLKQRKADILLMLRRFEDAAPLVRNLARTRPTAGTLFARANLRYGLGDYAGAVEDYRFVLSNGSPVQERAAANNLALLYAERLRNFNMAEFYGTVLVGLAPESFRTLATVGRVGLVTGNLSRAELFLQNAHKQRPEDVEVLLNLSLLAEKQGAPDKAERYRNQAKGLHEEWTEILDRLRATLPEPVTEAATPDEPHPAVAEEE